MEIEDWRKKIDQIDELIISQLAERFLCVKKIGALKKQVNKQVFDKEREEKIYKNFESHSVKYNLDPEFVKKVFNLIIEKSRNIQK